MCGINGIIVYRGSDRIDRNVLRRTRDHMAARGPDGFGEWFDPDGHVGFGHRRLSIIDLTETGAQPMTSCDDSIVVTFNGEIYNYRQLRSELETAGCVFQSQSDTEVLIHLYNIHGTAMLSRLRGMFAFGLWDKQRQILFLARDPYGIKPLYYADDGRSFRFASSVKALIAGGDLSREPEPAGLAGFYIFGSVPEPWTTYQAVKALAAGSFITIGKAGMSEPVAYFSLAGSYCQAERNTIDAAEAASLFRSSVLDSVRHHLVADVPVGAFLSAGIDSGALVGLMRDAGQNEIRTVTLAFEAYRGSLHDESVLAQQVAEKYGTQHTTRWVGAEEFHRDLPKIIAAMDQPSIDGINTWFVSKATREAGLKVALSGVGGDELLGGYHTFSRIPELTRFLGIVPKFAGLSKLFGRVTNLARHIRLPIHPKTAGLLALGNSFAGAYLLQRSVYLPDEVQSMIIDQGFLQAGLAQLQPMAMIGQLLRPEPGQDFSKVAVLESGLYLRNQLLRDTDWAGMAHSVEVRTPLVDAELLQRVAPLFARRKPLDGKALLAKAPTMPLPRVIAERKKTGFGIPVKSWYRDKLDGVPNPLAAKEADRLWSRTWAKQIAIMSDLTLSRNTSC